VGNQVLIIDDDEKLGRLLVEYVKQYDLQASHCSTPSAGLRRLTAEPCPDLLVLDVMLPEMDGFELCRQIRQSEGAQATIPIIMLTARGEVTDRIVGLELGADDYLSKPFEPRELVARIHNILRRQRLNQSGTAKKQVQAAGLGGEVSPCQFESLRLHRSNEQIEIDGECRELTTMEYELLNLLISEQGKTWSRDELMSALRGIDADIYSRAVDTLVSRLRHKLNDTAKTARFIKTVWGKGYRFIAQPLNAHRDEHEKLL
jgi:OmpR family response regulator RpaB